MASGCGCCSGLWGGRRSAQSPDDGGAYAALVPDGEESELKGRHGAAAAGAYKPPTPSRLVKKSSNRSLAAASVPVPALKDFKLRRVIGKGGFSKVLQVQHKQTQAIYALKAVSKAMLKGPKEEERLLAEAQILRRIQHPFCITLQFSFQTQRELLYVFDFVPGGVLYHHLKQNRYFNEARARFYIAEIILALEYLHGLAIVYRDLKLENCLIARDGHLCLTDFGAAKDLMGEVKTATFCGTPCYIAPEILRGEQYDQSVDWWTTGVILYEMLVGTPPFTGSNRHALYKNVLKAPIGIPERLSTAARDIIMQFLQRNPQSRLGGHMISRGGSASVIKAHDFFYLHKARPTSQAGSPPAQGAVAMATSEARAASMAKGRLSGVPEGEDMEDSMEESSVFDGVRRPSATSAAIDATGADVGRRDDAADGDGSARRRARGQTRRLDSLEPTTWSWADLEKKNVDPPWIPSLVSDSDISYFDPIVTSETPSLADLPGMGAKGAPVRKEMMHIDDFDFAREQVGT